MIDLLETFLHLQISIELHEVLPEIDNGHHFLHEQSIELLDVDLHVAAWLLHFVDKLVLLLPQTVLGLQVLLVVLDEHILLPKDFPY